MLIGNDLVRHVVGERKSFSFSHILDEISLIAIHLILTLWSTFDPPPSSPRIRFLRLFGLLSTLEDESGQIVID